MTHPAPRKPWFGSKRIGWGISPQTWQGWTITLGATALLIVIVNRPGFRAVFFLVKGFGYA